MTTTAITEKYAPAQWVTTKLVAEGDLVHRGNGSKPHKTEPLSSEFSEVLGLEVGATGKKMLLANGSSINVGHATKLWVRKDLNPDTAAPAAEATADGDLAGIVAEPPAQPEPAKAPAKAKSTKKAPVTVASAPAKAPKVDNGTRANPASLPVGWSYTSKAKAAGGEAVTVTKLGDKQWKVTAEKGGEVIYSSRSAAYVAMRDPKAVRAAAKAAK